MDLLEYVGMGLFFGEFMENYIEKMDPHNITKTELSIWLLGGCIINLMKKKTILRN